MTVTVRGTNYNIRDREDFSRLLEDELGYEVAQLYKEFLQDDAKVLQKRMELDSVQLCTGECDRVLMVHEHYQDWLREIADNLDTIYAEEVRKYKNPHCTGIRRISREIYENL